MKNQSRRKPKEFPRLYSCTQQNSVSVAKLVWGYCLALITRFVDFSASYTPEFVADMIKQIDAANDLPNQEQRANAKQTAHKELVLTNAAVRSQWKALKRYIVKAYDKSLWKIKLDAAGQTHYQNQKGGRWDNTLSMIKDAKQFMKDFGTDLEAKNNMPKGFPTVFSDAAAAFEVERNRFVGNTQTAREGTGTKDKAIYDMEQAMSLLLADGKIIFEKEPENLRKFTFANLIKEVRGNESAGVKGILVSESGQRPIEGVMVSSGDYSTTSDADGRYVLRMASGVHDIMFEKPGFQTLVLEGRVVKVGVMGRYNASMMQEQPGQGTSSAPQSPSTDAQADGLEDAESPAPAA